MTIATPFQDISINTDISKGISSQWTTFFFPMHKTLVMKQKYLLFSHCHDCIFWATLEIRESVLWPEGNSNYVFLTAETPLTEQKWILMVEREITL